MCTKRLGALFIPADDADRVHTAYAVTHGTRETNCHFSKLELLVPCIIISVGG